jgi:hypothetical protein
MPVKVHCPTCAKELSAPDDLRGKTVACPRCNQRFEVEDNGETSLQQNMFPPSSHAFPPGYEPSLRAGNGDQAGGNSPPAAGSSNSVGAVPPPPGVPPVPPQRSSPSRPAVPPAANPAAHQPVLRSPAPPPVASGSAPAAQLPGAQPPEVEPPGAAPPAPPPSPGPGSPVPPPVQATTARFKTEQAPVKPTRRTRQAAHFITAGETASHVQLGADGKLPDLVLREGQEREKPTEQRQGISPLVLAAAAVSLLLSAAVLFIDVGDGGETASKQEARAAIKKYYTQVPGSLDTTSSNKPYQYYLREAIWAHRAGDYAAEAHNYRHVMDLLNNEGKSDITGLTGRIGTVETKPSDRHLEKQLSILLRD